MSEQVSIERKVSVDFGDGGEHEVSATVDFSVDYVECEECGEQVDFTVSTDSYGDIQIKFKPHNCEE